MMKRLAALLGALTLAGFVYAAVTPANTDFVDYCTGANNSNCVFQINSSGNTTGNNVSAQGTLSVTGAATVNGASTLVGAVTAQSSSTVAGLFITPPTNYNVFFASNSVPVTSSYVTITSSGANLLLTGTPSIATTTLTSSNWNTTLPISVTGISNIPDGTWIVIGSTSTQAIMFRDNSVLSNSLLNIGLNGQYIISSTQTLTAMFNKTAGKWVVQGSK